MGLIVKYFFENLTTEKYPNNVISVSKRDIQNIKEIQIISARSKQIRLTCSSIDLSKLESLGKLNNNKYKYKKMIFFKIYILF